MKIKNYPRSIYTIGSLVSEKVGQVFLPTAVAKDWRPPKTFSKCLIGLESGLWAGVIRVFVGSCIAAIALYSEQSAFGYCLGKIGSPTRFPVFQHFYRNFLLKSVCNTNGSLFHLLGRVRWTDVVDRIHLSVPLHVTDRSVTSRTVAQHIESVTHHSVSARTNRRRLQQSVLSARRPLLGLPLTQNHGRLNRQWCDERRRRAVEWNEVVFTDESRICLQHHDGQI
ncbi:transposable element Tcb1 transposase [Trichonephila clavipes]|nr:transposable element Tcb1 transposase [Trichonephila clavipes]